MTLRGRFAAKSLIAGIAAAMIMAVLSLTSPAGAVTPQAKVSPSANPACGTPYHRC